MVHKVHTVHAVHAGRSDAARPRRRAWLVGRKAQAWLAHSKAFGSAKGKAFGSAKGKAFGSAKGKAFGSAKGKAFGSTKVDYIDVAARPRFPLPLPRRIAIDVVLCFSVWTQDIEPCSRL